MKKIIFYLTLFFCGLIIVSCKKKDPIGLWSDNINLSQKTANFNANTNSITITTKTTNWWFTHISFNGNNTYLSNADKIAQNFIINNPDFTIERKDGNKIIINLSKNATNNERSLNIGLQNGDFFDGISVTQSK